MDKVARRVVAAGRSEGYLETGDNDCSYRPDGSRVPKISLFRLFIHMVTTGVEYKLAHHASSGSFCRYIFWLGGDAMTVAMIVNLPCDSAAGNTLGRIA